jgi:hypothetical protein
VCSVVRRHRVARDDEPSRRRQHHEVALKVGLRMGHLLAHARQYLSHAFEYLLERGGIRACARISKASVPWSCLSGLRQGLDTCRERDRMHAIGCVRACCVAGYT